MRRLYVVIVVSVVVTFGAVLIGGVPLLLGLGATSALALGALPGGSRQYLLKRVTRLGGTLFVAMAVAWLLVHNYPDASRQSPTGFIPAMERYATWLGDLVVGEMGESSYSETVSKGVSRTIPISAQLVLYSQILAVSFAVPAALIGAWLRGRFVDVGFRAAGLLALAVPMFVSGPILAFTFGVGEIGMFGWSFGVQILPTGRYVPIGQDVADHFRSMVLPSVTLALSSAAAYLVLLRSQVLQQLLNPHVDLAKSKGLSPARIVRVHGLRPAAPTLVAAVAAQSGLLFGNLLIIERIFLIPGFGDYVLVAIGRRDDLAVIGGLFVAAAILAVVNLFADALLLVIDPRIEV